MFACGASNFASMDHDEPPAPAPAPVPLTPKSPPKSSTTKKQKQNKNPYAARGLDKFSMVLAELETKKEKIMEKAGSERVAMVRFTQDHHDDSWVPIIIRPPKEAPKPAETVKKILLPSPAPVAVVMMERREEESVVGKEKRKSRRGRGRVVLRWREGYYWHLVMVMILLCLVMFGRVFAIFCTCVWWYMVPNYVRLNKERISSGGGGGVVRKKEMGRGWVVQVKGRK